MQGWQRKLWLHYLYSHVFLFRTQIARSSHVLFFPLSVSVSPHSFPGLSLSPSLLPSPPLLLFPLMVPPPPPQGKVAQTACMSACKHLSTSLMQMLLDTELKQISMGAIQQFNLDVIQCERKLGLRLVSPQLWSGVQRHVRRTATERPQLVSFQLRSKLEVERHGVYEEVALFHFG